MDPTENIQTRKRSVELNTNWDICFILQNDYKDPIRKLGSCELERVQNVLRKHKKYLYYARWDVVKRLEAANFVYIFSDDTELVYYKDCYGTFTSSMHLKRLQNQSDSKTSCSEDNASTSTNEHPSQRLRSKFRPLNTALCVFCQQQSREKTRLAASLPFFLKATTSCSEGQCIK